MDNFLSIDSFSFEEVSKRFSQIDRSSGTGVVDIPAFVFRESSEALKEPITYLFNLCLTEGKLPNDWKITLVRPHYKGKGEKLDPDSYRTISVLPPIAKVFESLLAERISDFF